MARQEPWANVPVVRTRDDPRQNEREQAETRYRNTTGDTNPLARPVILAGEEGYAGNGTYLPDAGVVVRNEPWADTPVASYAPVESDPLSAFAASAAEQIPFLDEAAAGVTGLLTGRPYSEVRALQQEIAADDRQNQTLARNVGGVSGFAAGLAAPGGAYIRGARGLQQVGRAAAVGGAYGGLYGSGAADDSYSSRLAGLGVGAVTGAAGGALTQRAAQAVSNSPVGQRLASIAGVVRGNRADPEVTAAQRLARTVSDPEAAIAERARLRALGVEPSLVDVTGGTTERLVRTAAGPAGPGAESAVANMAARQANLKPEVMGVTRGLSDDPRSALAVREGLETTRGTLADQQYAPAYAERVVADDQTLRALSDEPGRAALRRARAAAVARQNDTQIAEIDQLLSGVGGEVSAGTLDRVRIAMAGRAQAMQQRPDTRDIASGLFGRAGQIDNALEAVPGLAPARETYRNLSGAMEAIDNASQVFNTDPRDFAQIVRELTPEQRQAMVIGVRQEIMDTLGGQRAAGTGSLQTLSQAPYARQNLEALLGSEEAARYIGSIRARVEQAQRAARVSPSTNSQTFGRAQDEAAVNAVEVVSAALDGFQTAGGNALAGARTANRLSSFVAARTMTPEVRAAIVDLGIGSADELERVLELGSTARAANRPPPREVRAYLAKVQGQLGAQNPVTVRLEQLLLPSRVSAEEEAQ